MCIYKYYKYTNIICICSKVWRRFRQFFFLIFGIDCTNITCKLCIDKWMIQNNCNVSVCSNNELACFLIFLSLVFLRRDTHKSALVRQEISFKKEKILNKKKVLSFQCFSYIYHIYAFHIYTIEWPRK